MALELRIAETERDAVLIFRAVKAMHSEDLVPGPFIDLKVLTGILRMVGGPGSCVLMAIDDDKCAGVCGLVEETYWYNDDRFLADKFLYVHREHRDGEALKILMNGAKSVGDQLDLPVFITINNGRRKRGGRSSWERVGATLDCTNRGAMLAHFPET